GARLAAAQHPGADHDPGTVAEPGHHLAGGVHAAHEVEYPGVLADPVGRLVAAGEDHRVVPLGVELLEGDQRPGGLVHREGYAVLADDVGAVLGGHVYRPALFEQAVVAEHDVVV